MERLTDLLASDFRDFEGALGSIAERPKDWTDLKIRVLSSDANAIEQSRPATTWDYDIYVSYSHQSSALNRWIHAFIDSLNDYLALELPDEPRVFLDPSRLSPSSMFPEALSEAMSRSKLLLAFITPSYFTSEWCGREWSTFESRELKMGLQRQTSWPHSPENTSLIKPVLLRGRTSAPEKLITRLGCLFTRQSE